MNSTKVSVLLVERDPYMCEIFTLVLDYHEIPHRIAQDAESALAYLRDQGFSIVIIEYYLATIHNDQLLDALRALASDAKFIVTSAQHSSDRFETIGRHGFDGFIPKPFDVGVLVPYLRKVVSSDWSEDSTDFWGLKR